MHVLEFVIPRFLIAQHVSSDTSLIIRSSKTVFTASGFTYVCGCRPATTDVGYCYPSGLEKTLCKWDIYAPLVTKRLLCLLPPCSEWNFTLNTEAAGASER